MEYMSWEEAGLIVGTEEWKEKQNNEKDPHFKKSSGTFAGSFHDIYIFGRFGG